MFQGCFVALVTPFRDGSVDFNALEDLVETTVAGGVHGLVPCGTTGESPTLTSDEQEEVVRTVAKRAAGRVPVVAGTGSNSTRHTVHQSQRALAAGADGVMLVSPYYNKPNQAGLYRHFSTVAEAVHAPILLYNIPGRTGVEIEIETLARLYADHENIMAVKHATGSIDGASRLRQVSDIIILSGDDTLTLPLISIGASGVVSVIANLMPRESAALVNTALNGDMAAAGAWHRRLFPIAHELLTRDTNPIPIKTALASRGMMAEEFRLPLDRMDADRRHELEKILGRSAVSEAPRQIA